MSGEYMPLVGPLLGHRRHRTTVGNTHLADGHFALGGEMVGHLLAEHLLAEAMKLDPQ